MSNSVALQAALSMGFPRQEYWLPFPPPKDLPDSRIEATSPVLAGRFFTTEQPGKHTAVLTNLKYLMTIKTTCELNIAQVDKICEKKF